MELAELPKHVLPQILMKSCDTLYCGALSQEFGPAKHYELASVKKFQTGDQPTMTKHKNIKTEKLVIVPQQSITFNPETFL